MKCVYCGDARARVKRPKTADAVCVECFFRAFEREVHETIVRERMFVHGEKVAIGASGGKDSTVLAYVLQALNARYGYGLDLFLLSIDEGIAGYRDDSLRAVQQHQVQYELPLYILPYSELFGWSMDQVVEQEGRRANCTYCGVFRRQALDRGAIKMNADKIATGHNADDLAETVLLNLLRGDFPRLTRCIHGVTMDEDCGQSGKEAGAAALPSLPRVKPLKWCYEKEIVLYAYFKKLDYFATECIYSPEAYRGHVRALIKDLEAVRPSTIADTIVSAGLLPSARVDPSRSSALTGQTRRACSVCGYLSSQSTCKACLLLESLNARKHA
ncbi:Cytoplasmic tRNA 2-thiolation protein 1 [Porphyridium purpureum]|uniref:Cytoplasmic tRNA 2-thiolation protein 1 n=1 Tax=Porphyridium purpureum TaxID=35688 RepID=A0A5J4YIV8_PORPP|nr:Cytoplasmic tRNA 2-thiolation protein 1 [Porphyridium purpureum]|eukprot:POR6058..scf270_19